ncbi:hypothetical protein GLW08_11085 [Pontibacillus yanchengensis]|uniref:Uncharacterized protein n=1 Tax=Pontibacillus yanchengensis TaxID=462910 RepID=A0ACC7VGZ5_9BACI|nr:hypothetical protein [Pontibacillus yanchengensis]MYL53880.1 hypothetical protein [Pontibacillus yanchengensis]
MMNFCTECGHPMKEDQMYCEECGTKREVNPNPKQKEIIPNAPYRAQRPKQPMSKQNKFILATLGIVAVLLIGTHFILTSLFDPMKTIQAVDRALIDNDSGAFFQEVSVDEAALLDKQQYLTYVKELEWDQLRAQLVEAVEAEEGDFFDTPIMDPNGGAIFVVKREAIIPGLYFTYSIEAIPNQIALSSNFDSTFSIDDRSIDIQAGDYYTDFLTAYPGEYTIVGTASNQYGKFNMEERITVEASQNQKSKYELHFPSRRFYLDTNESNAILFLNGKSTNKRIADFQGELGPLPTNGRAEVYAEWTSSKGEKVQSQVLNLNEHTSDALYIDIVKPKKEEAQTEVVTKSKEDEKEEESNTETSETVETSISEQQAIQHVLTFRNNYETALNTKDYSKIANFLLDGGSAYEELFAYINDIKGEEFVFNFTRNQVTNSKIVNKNTALISTAENFIFTNNQGQQMEYDRYKTYTVMLIEGVYKIKTIDISDTETKDL